MLPQKRLRNGPKSCSTTAGRSKRQYRSDKGNRFTSRFRRHSCEGSLEWGSFDRQEIPQMGELFSTGDGEGGFRTKNIMVPMLTIAVAVAIWTPVTIAACKWKAGGIDCRHPSTGQNSHTSDLQQWRFFYCLSNAGNTQGSHFWILPRDTRIARLLLGQFMAALRTNVPDLLAMGPLPCLLLLGLPCQINTFPE